MGERSVPDVTLKEREGADPQPAAPQTRFGQTPELTVMSLARQTQVNFPGVGSDGIIYS